MPVITEAGKRKRNRGKGHGADYKPWILTREFNSTGTTANIIDWKHGRTIQLLSQGEEWFYYYLRWDDSVIDIREQFPLFEPEDTVKIAEQYGFRHPKNNETTMTTDFLVDYANGKQIAYSIKSGRKDVDYQIAKTESECRNAMRTAEKLLIEKTYWNDRGIEWKLLFKEDLDPQFINNIRRVVVYYDKSRIHDETSALKHLIATKQIEVDMYSTINYKALVKKSITWKALL